MPQHTSSGAALRIEKTPIPEAIHQELMASFRERREAIPIDEILSAYTAEEISAWEEEKKQAAEQERLRAEQEEKRKKEDAIIASIEDSGIPPRYRKCRFETLQRSFCEEAYDACQAYVDAGEWQGQRGLLLKGPPGTGKTSLAVASLLKLVDLRPGPIRFLALSMVLQRARESFGADGSPWSVDEAIRGRIVVLDDLGRQRPTDWTAETIYTLIGQIYDNNSRVIITTNATKEQWDSYLDEAIRSRITEMCFPLVLAGRDLRTGNKLTP